MLWPIYEFRPLIKNVGMEGQIYRYADGKWIKDDGEYDLAFASIDGFPTCLYVSVPWRKNILWSWVTEHWQDYEPKHPNGNAWHYMLRDGEKKWGGDWGRYNHPNEKAGREGMDWVCGQCGCSNGDHVEFNLKDQHILAGLVREKETKKILTIPEHPICMYCGRGC